jgi:hypothetical protein
MRKQEPLSPPQPYSIFFVSGIVVGDWVGTPTLEAVRASFKETIAQPEFRKGMPTMAQFREEIVPPDETQLRAFAAEMAAYREYMGPTALVVNSRAHAHVARQLSSFCHQSGVQAEVFTQTQDAFSWLRREMERQPGLAGG